MGLKLIKLWCIIYLYLIGVIFMKSDKELFSLARQMVFINDSIQRGNVNEFEREELFEEGNRIRNVLLKKEYDVNKFVHYQELHKTMTVGEYIKFVQSLE